jgi:hypothetical protein
LDRRRLLGAGLRVDASSLAGAWARRPSRGRSARHPGSRSSPRRPPCYCPGGRLAPEQTGGVRSVP